jgi:hypothetical protein
VSTTQAPIARSSSWAAADTRSVTMDRDEVAVTIGQLAALLGLAFGLAAFAFEPFLFGSVGITLGLVGKHTGTALGRVTIAVAMLGTILGPTFGSVVYAVLVAG